MISTYGRRPLRSSTDRALTVPRIHNRFGDRSFAVAGFRLWNSLPMSLRQISSYTQFGRYLKNRLFGIWEITAQCDAWFSALYKYSCLLAYLHLVCDVAFARIVMLSQSSRVRHFPIRQFPFLHFSVCHCPLSSLAISTPASSSAISSPANCSHPRCCVLLDIPVL